MYDFICYSNDFVYLCIVGFNPPTLYTMPMIKVSDITTTAFNRHSVNQYLPCELHESGTNKTIPFGTPLYRIDENGNVEGCIVTGFFYDESLHYVRAAGLLARDRNKRWAFSCGVLQGACLNIGLYTSATKALESIAKNGIDAARGYGNVVRACGTLRTQEVLKKLGYNCGSYAECGDRVYKWEWDGNKAVRHYLTIDQLWADENGYHARCDEEAGLELYTEKSICESAHIKVIDWDDEPADTDAKVEIDVKVSVKGELLAESKTEIKAKLAELKSLGVDIVGLG